MLVFLLEERLKDLQEARLNGADVSPMEEVLLEAAIEDALAAEAEAAGPELLF